MKTIIQDFPTIYGETINGSVYGQPNGSIARPPQNVAGSITLSGDTVTVTYTGKFPAISPEVAFYAVGGLTVSNSVTSYAYVAITVDDSGDNRVGGQTANYPAAVPSAELAGPYANKPTNGDTLSIKVAVYDQDNNLIVESSAISATAVVE